MSKKMVNEIFWLRSLACFAVVLLHSIEANLDKSSGEDTYILSIIRMALMFGTPAFVFISEFLLAKSYPNKLPQGFFKKRAQILLIPYVLMGVIYAIVESKNHSFSNLLIASLKNILLADFTIYFIVIIFQFYILHYFLSNYLAKWNPKKVLSICLVINILYLGFFNFVEPFDIPLSNYIWYYGSWKPFLGWIFYFALGYYCGKYYTQFLAYLTQYKNWLFFAPITLGTIIIILKYTGILETDSSKRIDVLFYTVSIIFLIFYLATKIKSVPSIVYLISNYSFSIYLIHKLFLYKFENFTPFNVYGNVILYFTVSMLLSIIAAYIINKLPYGKYLVGNVRSYSKPKTKQPESVEVLIK